MTYTLLVKAAGIEPAWSCSRNRWTTTIPRSDVCPSNSSRTSLSRSSGERYHRVSCRGSSASRRGGRNIAVGAGIEPAIDRVTICPVFQHTSPTRSGDGPVWAAPVLTRETATRFTHAVTPFLNCQRSRAQLRLGFRGLPTNQLRAVQSRTCWR
jgi:hypothetical protein